MVSESFPLVVLTVPLFVLALTMVLFFDRQIDALEQFTLICIALGAGLTMLVEVIVLKGDISRMNTVFKFYLQVWTLWAVSAAVWIPRILHGRSNPAATAGTGVIQLPAPPGWWRPAFAALVISGLLYPIFATYGRAHDRFETSTRVTLDGMAYMDTARYSDKDQAMILKWDREAIDWLLENVKGSPVIVEAVTPLYHWGSRVSVYTGLPTVIGWDWHQKQQRAVLPGDVVDRRINDVNQIFGSASTERTRELLDRYGVRYLYVGQQERLYYPGVDEKMRRNQGNLWNQVYENQEVSIYEVDGSEDAHSSD
jgi:YYY domain-containing protein